MMLIVLGWDTGDGAVDKETERIVNRQYEELRAERLRRIEIKDRELIQRGLPKGLDGPNYWQDIDDWYDGELNALREKYGIKKLN